MKKIWLLIFIASILFYSCKQVRSKAKAPLKNNDPGLSIKKTNYKGHYDDQLLKQYSSFLAGLNSSQIENSTIAATKFIELFSNQEQDTRDSAFFIFNKQYYYKLCNNLDSLHNLDTTLNYDSLVTDSNHHTSLLSPKLTSYAKKLKDNGFLVYMSEGDTYIGEDLDFVAKWFYPYVSPALKEYLMQLNKENKEGFSEDAGLTISPSQLADRTVWWEMFAKKYPNAIITNDAIKSWQGYLGTLLEGVDNTPVTENGDNTLSSYYKTAYNHIQSFYPTTETNKLIEPYYKLLLKKENKKADALVKEYAKRKMIAY